MKKAVEIQVESKAFVSMIGRVTPEAFEKHLGTPELIDGFKKFCEEKLRGRIEHEVDTKAVITSKVFVREIEVDDECEVIGE